MNVIKTHPEISWNWFWVSKRRDVSKAVVAENPDIHWVIEGLNRNPNYNIKNDNQILSISHHSWEDIKANFDNTMEWTFISCNPNITWNIIETHPNKPWDWWSISRNPNITWDIVHENPNKPWDWYSIFDNPSIYKPDTAFISKFVREWQAKNTICRAIMKCYTNPDYKICQKRLLREYETIVSTSF